MRRKALQEIIKQVPMETNGTDMIIAILLKRTCNFEEAVMYLLSAITDGVKDDMVGELVSEYERLKMRSKS